VIDVATLLVHIRVKPGMEARFERVVAGLYRPTHEIESAVRRYEYFRGADPATYYCLLSFDDYHGFLAHQSSPHHEAAVPELRELTEEMRLEWLDPLQQASPLAPTDPQPLPPDASTVVAHYHERFDPIGAAWWGPLRSAATAGKPEVTS
jgi:quinol monooxygenase YgiN